MAEGSKKKKRQGEEVDIKEETKEGIIEVFAGSKRRQLVDEFPSVCPFCCLPLHLLSSSTAMATPRVHMQDCKDTMVDGESNLLLRDFCSDIKDCKSLEVGHYSKFNHSLQDWDRYQELEASYLASREQQEGCFEADQGSEEVGMQSSEEGCETGEESRDTFEEGGETAGMSSSEEEGEKDELRPKTGERSKDVTSPPSSASYERRPKPSFSPADERRELLVNKEAEQLKQVNKEVNKDFDNGCIESNMEVEQSMQVNKELKEANEDLMQLNSYSFSPVITEERVEQLVDEVDKGASSWEQPNSIGIQQGGDDVGLEAVEFSEHLGEGGDQEEFSHQVQGLIQGLEDISQQPLVLLSEVEDDEADFFQLSNEVAQELEKIEQEHPGGLLTPDTSLNQSVPGEGSELDHLSDQALPPVMQKPGVEERGPRNAQAIAQPNKKMMLAKLADELNDDLRKRKVKDTNSGKDNTTVRNQDELSKDEDNNNNKDSGTSKERKNTEGGAEADKGEESDLEKVKTNGRVEPTPGNLRAATGLVSQKDTFSQLATDVIAENVKIFFEVQLQGRELIKKSIMLKPRHWFSKAMEAVALRLDKEVSSLRFLVAEGPCEWRRLVGKEKASSLAGATVVVKDAQ